MNLFNIRSLVPDTHQHSAESYESARIDALKLNPEHFMGVYDEDGIVLLGIAYRGIWYAQDVFNPTNDDKHNEILERLDVIHSRLTHLHNRFFTPEE